MRRADLDFAVHPSSARIKGTNARSFLHRLPHTRSKASNEGACDSLASFNKWRDEHAQISRLLVRIEGKATVGGAGSSVTYGQTLLREVTVTGEEATFGPGEHRFSFLITVPTSTACHEVSKHGKVIHVLSAVAETPGMLNNTVRRASRSLL